MPTPLPDPDSVVIVVERVCPSFGSDLSTWTAYIHASGDIVQDVKNLDNGNRQRITRLSGYVNPYLVRNILLAAERGGFTKLATCYEAPDVLDLEVVALSFRVKTDLHRVQVDGGLDLLFEKRPEELRLFDALWDDLLPFLPHGGEKQ